jgi:hypothetical protein
VHDDPGPAPTLAVPRDVHVQARVADDVDLRVHPVQPAVLDQSVDDPRRHAHGEQLGARDQPASSGGDGGGASNLTSSPHTGD